jgi:hypothetical protein
MCPNLEKLMILAEKSPYLREEPTTIPLAESGLLRGVLAEVGLTVTTELSSRIRVLE